MRRCARLHADQASRLLLEELQESRSAQTPPCVDGSPLARGFFGDASLVGAAVCSTCWCGTREAAGHDAVREAWSRPKTRAQWRYGEMWVFRASGFDPLAHHFMSALPKLICDRRGLCRGRLAISRSAAHDRPNRARGFVRQGHGRNLRLAARHQIHEPWPPRAVSLRIAQYGYRTDNEHF